MVSISNSNVRAAALPEPRPRDGAATAAQPGDDSMRSGGRLQAPPAIPGREAAAEPERLRRTAEEVESHVQSLHRSLHFTMDEDSGELVVRVVDKETNEVIRQIPSEEMLAIARHLEESMGLLLSEEI